MAVSPAPPMIYGLRALQQRSPRRSEVLVPLSAHRATLPQVKSVRSTLLVSSLRSVRDRSLFDRYLELLPQRYHDTVRSVIAGVWLPIDLGIAHYEACGALGFSTAEQIAIGREVGAKIQGTLIGTMLRMSTSAGMTPWVVLTQYQKLWDRLLIGGGVVVTKLGPKEASVELVSMPLSRIPYFRCAFRGLNISGCELFCTKAYAEDIASLASPTSMGIRISWA
jgi:hypothetical protein